MRVIVDGTKSDLAIRSVVVDRQIREPLIARPRYEAMDKLRRERAISDRTLNIIRPLLGEMHLAHMQHELSAYAETCRQVGRPRAHRDLRERDDQ